MRRVKMYRMEQKKVLHIIASLVLVIMTLSISGCVNILDSSSQTTPDVVEGRDIEIDVIEGDKVDGEEDKVDEDKNDDEGKGEREDNEDGDLDIGGDRQDIKLVPYSGPVQHIFFHPLIAYPELTFDGDAQEKGFNDYFVTIDEFNKVIQSLYEKDFILIDINLLIEEVEEDGKKVVKRRELMLPEGKKPLIISIDDMNYYEYMRENGMIYKLILDDKGQIATYSITPEGEERVAYDNEIIPLLDRFVERHPDFSFNGAKGVIALTGYEGVLGYRTNEIDSPNFEKEKEEALLVINKLKEMGWTFASHGYGHRDAARISLEALVKDTERWKVEVGSLVGPTKTYIYPYGSRVLPGDPKFQSLVDAGFQILCAVGSQAYEKMGPNALMQDRRHIDGIGLIQQRERFLDLFDSYKLIDYDKRPEKYLEGIKK